MTICDLAECLRVTKTCLYKMVEKGGGIGKRVGRRRQHYRARVATLPPKKAADES